MSWADNHMGMILVMGLVVIVMGFSVFGYFAIQDYHRLMVQCLSDGHKEYECHSLLDSHNQTIPVPIIIPIGR